MIGEEIPGVREIRQFVVGFRPDGLRRWRSLHLVTGGSDADPENKSTDLTIQAEYEDDSGVMYVIEMKMFGIRELRFPDMREWFGFDTYVIEDVRANQWEGVGYRVAECEEGRRFLCLCRSVAFTKLLVTEPGTPDQVIWNAIEATNHD
jgi:hypothetical protein